MASKHVGTEVHDNGTVIITVRHTIVDSFSRSVDRVAKNAWRRLPLEQRRATVYMVGDYAHETIGTECWSRVAFGPSFPAAYDAIGRPDLARTADDMEVGA